MNPQFNLTDAEGGFLVRLARAAIDTYLRERRKISPPKDTPPKLREKCGVFVTLNIFDETGGRQLRGCIGYPEALMPLVEATIDAAVSSAVRDPRFKPLTLEELGKVVVEVSVLTPLKPVNVKVPTEYPRNIKVGVDGLVVERGGNRGLLLPQVAVEWRWDEEEFLCNCCMKAGLAPDAWLDGPTRIYKFTAILFEEETPIGKVHKVPFNILNEHTP